MRDKIEQDIKSALLGGDKTKTEVLRNLKSAFLYEAVALGVKDVGLNDEQMQKVIQREAKKRQEAIDLYTQAGEAERAAKEESEKTILDSYLPERMSEDKLLVIVKREVAKVDSPTIKDMGRIISEVRNKTAGSANGSLIAKLVKQSLDS